MTRVVGSTQQLTPRVAVGLVTKAPEPGAVKTRLCPPLSLAEAAEAAAAMLVDTLAGVQASAYEPCVVFTGDEAVLRREVGHDVALLAQRGRDLGERLAAAQADLFDRGFAAVVLLGGDCPTVGPAVLREAVEALTSADVTVVPAADGGYAALASTCPTPRLFTEVAMSTARTGTDTVARARAEGLATRVLAVRHDVDTGEALLAALRAGELDHAPATKAVAERVHRLSPRT